MKRMLPYIVMVIVALVLFDFFDQPSAPPMPEKAQEPPVEAPAAVSELYALRAGDYSWPALTAQQQVAEQLLTKNYYVVLDGSGSMLEEECSEGSNKMQVAKQAITGFIEALPQDVNIGLYAFDKRGIGERVALGSNNRATLNKALRELRPGGGTPLSLSVSEGLQALTDQAVSQLGYGEYHLVVITDGMASQGYSPDQAVAQVLAGTPVNVHTIGFCIDDQHSLNQPGRTFYRSANDPSSLMAGLQEVMAEAPDFTLTEFN